MIGKTISHYRILDKLGEGGMGVVYKAQDTKLDRLVALKFLPPHLATSTLEKERFLHEAKAASALTHPNITVIHEISEAEGQVYICMEYVEGKTLKQMAGKESLPVKKMLEIAIGVCEGLNAAHKKDIVHRDIKSDNIMVTKEGQVKVMDFGLAKLRGATRLTKAGSTVGTTEYMSPEQAQGEEIDQRSDIFSFGVVLYEMLTGQMPFKGEHQSAIIYSILNEEPQPVARYNNKVSPELERIVSKALAKDTEVRYQHIDDLLADLRQERKTLEYTKTVQMPVTSVAKPKRRLLSVLIPGSVILILAALFFILQPFKVEIGTQQRAIAQEHSLAVMYFENLVDKEDKERLGEIVTNLLITDLSESQYMEVVSSQRLYDILKLLGQEGAKVIDKGTATKIATQADAKWMLLGSILELEPQVTLTSQLVEVKTGKVVASQRLTGNPGEKIFSLVDKLTVEIKKDLTLPTEAKTEFDPKVANVTTSSPEAYRFYLDGLDNINKAYSKEATESFQKALQHDSTFAMVYFQLAALTWEDKQKEMVAKAVKYANKASYKEQMYIRALEAGQDGKLDRQEKELKKLLERYPEEKEAWLWLGETYHFMRPRQLQQAINCYHRVIEIDPNHKMVYNEAAYAYDGLGKFDSSIWAINKYIVLAPDEANPYDSRGDLYAYNGKLEEALESYQKALEIKADYMASVPKLGHMYLFKGDYVRAESVYQALAAGDDKGWRASGRGFLALVPMYQAKFQQALKVLDDGLGADRMEKVGTGQISWKYGLKRQIYEERGQLDSAIKYNELVRDLVGKEGWRSYRGLFVRLYAKKKEFQKAEAVAESIRVDIEKEDKSRMYDYWWFSAYIAKEQGNLQKAVELMERGLQATLDTMFGNYYISGQAYLEEGRLDEAVALLEKGLKRYDDRRINVPIWAVKAYYYLAQAYDKSGWKQKAIENYQRFLEIWKNADPGIIELEEAKKRLEELKKQV